jgi:hypothetical protein
MLVTRLMIGIQPMVRRELSSFFFTGRLLLRAFDRLDRHLAVDGQLAGVEDRAIVALASQVQKLAALDGNLPGNEYIILLRNCVQSRECLKIKI